VRNDTKAVKMAGKCCRPNPAVNYTFISAVYFALAVLSGVLYWLEKSGTSALVNGWWIIPAPAAPCCVYALAMRAMGGAYVTPTPGAAAGAPAGSVSAVAAAPAPAPASETKKTK